MSQSHSDIPQGGELTIRLDDGMVLKSRVRGITIDAEVDYGSVHSQYSYDSPILNYMESERYTLTAEFDGAYTIYNAPAAAHRVRINVTDSSIKGLMEAQKAVGAPDTAEIVVGKPNEFGQTPVTFKWEA